jgi:hypothetical protein
MTDDALDRVIAFGRRWASRLAEPAPAPHTHCWHLLHAGWQPHLHGGFVDPGEPPTAVHFVERCCWCGGERSR